MRIQICAPETCAYEYSVEVFQIFCLCFLVEYELNAEALDLSDIMVNNCLRKS